VKSAIYAVSRNWAEFNLIKRIMFPVKKYAENRHDCFQVYSLWQNITNLLKRKNTIVLPVDLLAMKLAQLTRSGNIFIIRCRFALPFWFTYFFILFYFILFLFHILVVLPVYDMITNKQIQTHLLIHAHFLHKSLLVARI